MNDVKLNDVLDVMTNNDTVAIYIHEANKIWARTFIGEMPPSQALKHLDVDFLESKVRSIGTVQFEGSSNTIVSIVVEQNVSGEEQ